MTSVLLQPGAMLVDGVGLTSLPDHSVVADAGFDAEVLYVANDYGTNRTAIERAWAAGRPVMLNYEGIDDDAKNGYPAGERAAHKAIIEARKLGFEGDCPLPFSASDKHYADIGGAGLDYYRATVDVLSPIRWKGGAYGFKEQLALLARQSWWPDDWPLWHWGGDGATIYEWTWVKQGPGGSYFDETINRQVDRNKLYKPMRVWSGYGPDEPPRPKEDDVFYQLFQLVDSDACFGGYWDGEIAQNVVWLDNPTFLHYRDDLHKPVRNTERSEMGGVYLDGPLPRDDSRHTWVAADFKGWSGGGADGKDGKDAPVPKAFIPQY